MFLYYSHTGGVYALPWLQTIKPCKVCGDKDTLIAKVKTRADAVRNLRQFFRETGYERPARAEVLVSKFFPKEKPGY